MNSKDHSSDEPERVNDDQRNGRDFADFLAGSDRLDTERTLPLPDSQDKSAGKHASNDSSSIVNSDAYKTTSERVEMEEAMENGSAPSIPQGFNADGEDDGESTEHMDPRTSGIAKKAVREKKANPWDDSLEKRPADGLNPEQRDRAEVIGTSVRWFAGWCLRFLIIAVASYVLARVWGKLWAGILPVLLALIMCTVLWPVARTLRKWHIPNALAVVSTILGFFAVLVGIFAFIGTSAVDQVPALVNKGNMGLDRIQEWLQGPPVNLKDGQFNDALNKGNAWVQERSGQIASQVASGASATASAVVTLVVMMVLTFFFLKDGEKFLPMVRRVTGRRVGWHLTEVLTRAWNTLGGYIRAQAMVSAIDAIFIGGGLFLLNVPLAGALAVLTFAAGFIPMVGAFVAGALSVLIALVANGFTTALLVLGLVILVQQLEGNVLSPWLQSKAMDLHPVVVLLAVTIGGTLFGIIGAFLAVPAAAVIAVVLRYMGDLTDLATGERTSDDINFVTTAGTLTGAQSQRAAERWQELRAAMGGGQSAHAGSKTGERINFTKLLNPLRKDNKDNKGK